MVVRFTVFSILLQPFAIHVYEVRLVKIDCLAGIADLSLLILSDYSSLALDRSLVVSAGAACTMKAL